MHYVQCILYIVSTHTCVCYDIRKIKFPNIVVQIILVKYYLNIYEYSYYIFHVNILFNMTGTMSSAHRSRVCVTYIT